MIFWTFSLLQVIFAFVAADQPDLTPRCVETLNYEHLDMSEVNQTLYNANHSSIVEFYDPWCSDCMEMSQYFEKFALEAFRWKKILKVYAVNCLKKSNGEYCRDYYANSFPTINYIRPFSSDRKGIQLDGDSFKNGTIYQKVFELMVNEAHKPDSWPNLDLFNGNISEEVKKLPTNIENVFLIVEPENGDYTVGQKVILDMTTRDNVVVRRTKKPLLNGGDYPRPWIFGFEKPSSTTDPQLLNTKMEAMNRPEIVFAMNSFIAQHSTKAVHKADLLLGLQCELSVKSISKFTPLIQKESKKAYLGVLTIIQKYMTLTKDEKELIENLKEIMKPSEKEEVREVFVEKIEKVFKEKDNVFKGLKYQACYTESGSKRGCLCGWWMLFHHLTVKAYEKKADNPKEVLEVLRAYMKNLFSCGDCAKHFENMAEENKLDKVNTLDNQILWLWNAHNQVNNRTKNSASLDSTYPKHPYPYKYLCDKCPTTNSFDEKEVLEFMKKQYSEPK